MMEVVETGSYQCNMSECAVCHQAIPKGRVHYGGVSCYSCRAFFRRNTQRDELPICKNGSGCRVTHLDRKQCSSCRYTKCLSIGMRRELVLDESGKQQRFKKYLRKKDEERKKGEEYSVGSHTDMPSLQPIPRMRHPLNTLLQIQQVRNNGYPIPFFRDPAMYPPTQRSPQMFSPFPFPSPPPSSHKPVDLSNQLRDRLDSLHNEARNSSMTSSGSIHCPLPPLSLSTTSLDPLTSFSSSQHRSSVIEKSLLMKEEEEASWKLEKEQSSEEEGATSSKRRYWPNQIPAASSLSSLPHGVKIKVELDLEEPEEVTEESLLQKYIHKKFSKAKTFSSDLAIAELENRKRRRSVIVHNTPAQTKMRHLDLRMFSPESQWKISPHHLRQSSGLLMKEASEEEFDDAEERGLMMADEDDVCRPVDLSRCLPSMSSSPWDTSSSPSCSSPRTDSESNSSNPEKDEDRIVPSV